MPHVKVRAKNNRKIKPMLKILIILMANWNYDSKIISGKKI